MNIAKLILRNVLRHKLRSLLTIMGIAIAVLAFTLLRTVVGAWYAGVDASSANRLIVRHSVSFIFPLPYSYGQKIRGVQGVKEVTYAVWFQGIYKDRTFENFFPRMAVDPINFFKVYPEFLIPDDQLAAFNRERNAAIVGIKTAQQHGFKIGDVIPIEGDIYPGKWEFVVRGFYKGRDKTTDETQMFFDWKYLDESLQKTASRRAGNVGWYVAEVEKANLAPRVSAAVDALFKNSRAETRTETEAAFNQSFVSMFGAIITAMNFISFVIIGIILLVLANTMAMTARERTTEYAVMKALGFRGRHIMGLIAGESLVIAFVGGVIGLIGAYPVIRGFQKVFPTLFPVMNVSDETLIFSACAALFVGVAAAIFPTLRTARMTIVDGLRSLA
jgi:putative ABC transport system permease protein